MAESSDISFEQLSLQAKLRIDAVCARFEAAWADERPRLEAFRDEAFADEQPVLLAELLFIEIECRRRKGETPTVEEYLGRFPEQEALIRQALPAQAGVGTGVRPDTTPTPEGRPTDRVVTPPAGPITVPGYELFEELGRGGMGVVYKARHLALNRLVALKFILAGRHAHSGQQDRFRREAEVIARLRHPNIVQIYDIGETDGRYFLALEYADAGSLRGRLAGAPLEPRLAVMLLEPLVRAVQHAHQQGVIHRDIKPANILLATAGDSVLHGRRDFPESMPLFDVPHATEQWALASLTPKLTDFGLAQFVGHNGAGEAGMPAGTPSYMAPEQVTGKADSGAAADIWALGVTLYELLAGRPPFRAATAAETLRLVLEAEPVPPKQLQPSVPQDLETICLKCLQKEPGNRYPNARDLAQDLRRFLVGETIQARREGRAERLRKWARRRPATALVFLLAFISFLAGVGGMAGALYYAFAGRERAQNSEEAAQATAGTARDAEELAKRQRFASERRLAAQLFDRAQQLGSRGEADRALSLLLQAFRLSSRDEAFQQIIRINLAGWSAHVHPLIRTVSVEEDYLCLAVDPNGRFLLTGTPNQQVRRRNLRTGKQEGSLWRLQAVPRFLTLSPERKRVLIGEEAPVARLRDAATGEFVGPEMRHDAAVTSALFLPGNQGLLTGCADGVVRKWNPQGQPQPFPRKHPRPVRRLSLSADGLWLAVALDKPDGGEGNVWLWNLADEKAKPRILASPGIVQALAFHPGEPSLLTGGADGLVRFWDMATGKVGPRFLWHPGAVVHIECSPDGNTILTATKENITRLWDRQTGQLLGVFRGSLLPGALIAGGKRFVIPGPGEIRVYERAHPPSLPISPPPVEPSGIQAPQPARRVTLDRTVKVVAMSSSPHPGSTVQLLDAENGKPLHKAFQLPDPARALAFTPDGRQLLAGDDRGMVRRWEVSSGKPVHPDLAVARPVRALAVHPDGKTLAVGSGEGAQGGPGVTFWDLQDGKQRETSLSHPGQVDGLQFSGDGKLLLVAGQSAQVYDLVRGVPLGERHRHVTTSLLSADGTRLVVARADRSVRSYDPRTGKPLGPALSHPHQVLSLALSADNQRLLVGGQDGSARVWDTRGQPHPLGPAVVPGRPVLAARFTADGNAFLTTAGDGNARRWQVPAPREGDAAALEQWVEKLTGLRQDPVSP